MFRERERLGVRVLEREKLEVRFSNTYIEGEREIGGCREIFLRC